MDPHSAVDASVEPWGDGGLFRLYASPDGKIVGYSWSVTKASEVYRPDERDLVIGHLNHQVKATGHPGRIDAEVADESGDDDDAPPPSMD